VAWHDGRLYVMNWNTQVVLRFDAPEDIVGTDAVGPDAVVSVPGFTGEGLSGGLAFDDEGRLWIAFANGLVRIDEPEAPMGTVDVAPDAALTQTGPENRLTLAYFGGTLYTADCDTSEVQRYDAVDAAVGTTARDPSAVFTVGQPCTADIAKDAAGRYWIASSGEVAGRYPDLATVGDGSVLSADVTVTHGEFPDGGGIAFRMTSLD
jgi:sugar lactone lactonase YvrE